MDLDSSKSKAWQITRKMETGGQMVQVTKNVEATPLLYLTEVSDIFIWILTVFLKTTFFLTFTMKLNRSASWGWDCFWPSSFKSVLYHLCQICKNKQTKSIRELRILFTSGFITHKKTAGPQRWNVNHSHGLFFFFFLLRAIYVLSKLIGLL